MQTASDKQKLREFITTRSTLQEMLNRSLSDWHKRNLDSNFKPGKELKFSIKGKNGQLYKLVLL